MVGLLSRNNKSTRYAANLQTTQTPDSVIALYALLAIFPAITALMALGGLVLEPSEVTTQLSDLAKIIPQEAAQIVLDQAVAVTGSNQGGLGFALITGVLLAIYSSSKGVGSLIAGLNVAYDEEEKRGFFMKMIWTLGLTLFLTISLLLGLFAALAMPAALSILSLPEWLENVLSLARWVILLLMTVFGLSVLYRYGPSRDNAEWKWLTPGAVSACLIWIAASIGSSIYVRNFGSYNQSFGSMAGVIILLMWLWISAFIVLLGAELNAEMEAQTVADTTVGADARQGTRGAKKADSVGEVE